MRLCTSYVNLSIHNLRGIYQNWFKIITNAHPLLFLYDIYLYPSFNRSKERRRVPISAKLFSESEIWVGATCDKLRF